MARINLTGQKFGKLTVIRWAGSSGHDALWECKCECGTIKNVKGGHLRNRNVKSCGCEKHPTRHGKCKTRIYKIWDAMVDRCASNRNRTQPYYRDKGITVCKEWEKDFVCFYDWAISHGYTDELTIDRIDVNGNYEPNNCRWATYKEQANNKTSNKIVNYQGELITLSQLADKLKANYKALWWYVTTNGVEEAIKYYKTKIST